MLLKMKTCPLRGKGKGESGSGEAEHKAQREKKRRTQKINLVQSVKNKNRENRWEKEKGFNEGKKGDQKRKQRGGTMMGGEGIGQERGGGKWKPENKQLGGERQQSITRSQGGGESLKNGVSKKKKGTGIPLQEGRQRE